MSNVLIAGCGKVGIRAGLSLVNKGHKVFGLRRNVEALPGQIRSIQADLGTGEGLQNLPGEIDSLVYMASADHGTEEAYQRAYVDGFKRILARVSASRVVFVSSTSVYGQTDGQWIDEESETTPRGFNGQVMLYAEQLALQTGRGTSLRLGGIYGPGRERLISRVRDGAACIEEPPQFTNRIHQDDAARAIVHLLELSTPSTCYLGVDNEPVPQHVVFDWIASQIGLARPPRVSPEAQSGSRRAGSKRCSNARLTQSGFSFDYPDFRTGYATML